VSTYYYGVNIIEPKVNWKYVREYWGSILLKEFAKMLPVASQEINEKEWVGRN